ncbi:agamous-like MADS-box protein AGL62 isoform X1 [Cornus florida]|uniref:agamous-like MADS-box protein AGL62 isoform X1 n=1 Tax=Cornus florida TaxID=4283 RepID=UPI00289F366E|nr:agamous-like MADS-box protein AGL62 isoform X1 [Cornus florida]
MERRKVKIKKPVSFSKRREGLFKKAAELSALCGADVAVVVKSPSGERIHGFGNPSVDVVFNRFLSQNPSSDREEVLCAGKKDEEKVTEDSDRVWWDMDIDQLGLNQLEEYRIALEVLRKNVLARADEMAMTEAARASSSDEVAMAAARASSSDEMAMAAAARARASSSDEVAMAARASSSDGMAMAAASACFSDEVAAAAASACSYDEVAEAAMAALVLVNRDERAMAADSGCSFVDL